MLHFVLLGVAWLVLYFMRRAFGFSLLWLCVAALILYCLLKGFEVLYFYFREYYVLWNIAMGSRSDRRDMNPNMRLHVYVCETNLLDEVSVNELYKFLETGIDSDVTITQFHHSVLLSYKKAILCRDRKDGSLRGVMMLDIEHKELNGAPFTYIRLGLGLFQNYYRGGPFMYYVVAYHAFKELIMHPFTPLYIIGKVFSHHSYMVLSKTVSNFYPRYDRKTPEFAREILNNFGMSCKSPSEEYDPDTFVLKRENTAIKSGIAIVNEEDLKNPHINFFVEQNPGWAKGHQMMAMGELRWSDMLNTAWRGVIKAVKGRKKRGANVRRKILKRCYSFQSELAARRYATVCSEMDFAGERKDVGGEKEDVDGEGEREVREEVTKHCNAMSGPPPERSDSNTLSYKVFDDI